MKFGVISSWVLMLFCLHSFGASRTVTTTTLDNMWWPVIPGSLQYEIFNASSGDTILFDYGSIGTSPVFNVDNRFYDTELGPNAGGYVVIDALRNKPIGADKPKITVTGTPGSGGALYVARANTSIIGLEVENVDRNGIRVTGSNVTIDSCVVHGSTNAGINVGGLANNITIKNSIVYENNQTVGTNVEHAGIYVLDATSITVDSCYVYSNNGNGVFFDNGADNSILSNSIIGRYVDGNELGNDWNGLFVRGADNTLMSNNIVVNNGKNPPATGVDRYSLVSGVRLQATTGSDVEDNYFGTDPVKTSAGNAFEGITLNTNVSNSEILRNVVCYNGFDLAAAAGGGIGLRRVSPSTVVSNCVIKSNFVGAHPDLTAGANNDYGISLEWGTNNIEIGGPSVAEGNVIANSSNSPSSGKGCGVWMVSSGTTDNVLQNNVIRDNEGAGVLISGGGSGAASGNIVGTAGNGNLISGNQYGIRVQDSGVNNNTLRYNSFSCNTVQAISLSSSGNDNYGNASVGAFSRSVIVNATEGRPNFISGYAPSANAVVDLYVADVTCAADCESTARQGFTYVATVSASASSSGPGLYFWEYDYVAGGSLVTPDEVVVLATETGAAGSVNTSEFSICADFCNIPENSTLTADDVDLCEGESVLLTASADGLAADEGYEYNWYLDTIIVDSLINTEVDENTFSVSTSGTYYVTISSELDAAACTDTTTALAIVVNALPELTIPVDEFTICTGDTADVTVVATVATGNPLEYNWTPDRGDVDAFGATSGGTYSLVVSDAVTGCSESGSVEVTENSLPVISISAPFFCQDDSTLVDAGVADMNYVWTPGGSTDQSFYVTEEDTFYVTVTNPETGCEASDSVFADQSPDPKPVITIAEFDTICKLRGDEVEVTSTVVSSTEGTYSWSTGESTSSITVSDTIDYIVTYLDSFACPGRDTITIINECIAPDPEIPNVVTINNPWTPFGDIDPTQVLESDLIIYNRWGIEIFADNENNLPIWRGTKEDGTECSAGVYYFIWNYRDIANKSYKYNGFIQLVVN